MKKLFAAVLLFVLVIIGFYVSQIDRGKVNISEKSGTNAPPQSITIISTGDIGLVRDINNEIQIRQDPNYPFLKIADFLKSADLTITNLEGPLIKNCPIVLTGFTFCGKYTNASGFTFAGIDAASLANNHATNFGFNSLTETTTVLKSNGIAPFGLADKIEYINIKNKKIALVSFVELGNNWAGLNNATSENVSRLVSQAKQEADIVICAFHWGVEYTRLPSQNQVDLAHLAIDNGADIILGNHPHWIQLEEVYKGKFITYAQGNTIFDQDWSQETKEGVIYKFEYSGSEVEKIDEKYTIIENNSQPRVGTEAETVNIKSKI